MATFPTRISDPERILDGRESPMPANQKLSIIGSGASAIYLLKHFLDHADQLKSRITEISIFEKKNKLGLGMPYSPEMTDRYHVANIPSEEMAPLLVSFADWLEAQDTATLDALFIEREKISQSKIYSRIALGRYLQSQYQNIVELLREKGITVNEHPHSGIVDLEDDAAAGKVVLITTDGRRYVCDKVVVAAGHSWPQDDRPDQGYYKSPWPIVKLLPKPGTHFNASIGTLGASLSAYDVIISLAHRHGEFSNQDSRIVYQPDAGTEGFKLFMHAAHGRLPHLRYNIEDFERRIYQHVSRETLLGMVNSDGFLRIADFFDAVCRPALAKAFRKDDLTEFADLVEDTTVSLEDFVERMSEEHDYPDAFEGMRFEMIEAKRSVLGRQPIFWKDVIDDLIYTLNFHAELLPAEDHLVLHGVVMPFLMNVIAAMPLESANHLLALYDVGKLEIISGKISLPEEQPEPRQTTVIVTDESGGEQALAYSLFVDCSGQKPIELEEYPFSSLVKNGIVRKARALFAENAKAAEIPQKQRAKLFDDDGETCFHIGGIDIDGTYRLVGKQGQVSNRIYDITFPHTSGVRPYSYGLQSCNDTGKIIVQSLLEEIETEAPVRSNVETTTEIYDAV